MLVQMQQAWPLAVNEEDKKRPRLMLPAPGSEAWVYLLLLSPLPSSDVRMWSRRFSSLLSPGLRVSISAWWL